MDQPPATKIPLQDAGGACVARPANITPDHQMLRASQAEGKRPLWMGARTVHRQPFGRGGGVKGLVGGDQRHRSETITRMNELIRSTGPTLAS